MEPELITQTIVYVALIIGFAKIIGEITERLGQPAVLGELLTGVLLAATLFKWMGADVAHNTQLQFLAELGVILLLFEIGLESDLEEFLNVGPSALAVALIGVACPFLAGYLAASAFGLPKTIAVFIGATLTATSVGITARTLCDLKKIRTLEARIILGAAVIDDVLGLIILAVINNLAASGTVSAMLIIKTSVVAIAFLAGAMVIGIPLAPYALKIARRMQTRGALMVASFVFCLILSYAAHLIHLATIIGAFAAGLILARSEHKTHICERIKPVADIFIPVFFVMLGVSVDLSVFNPFNPETKSTFALVGILSVLAVGMKLISGLGVIRKGVKKIAVGIGMIPRGEVGLIFASVGLAHNVITPAQYSAIIAVVIITTFITPPMLKNIMKEKPAPKSEETCSG